MNRAARLRSFARLGAFVLTALMAAPAFAQDSAAASASPGGTGATIVALPPASGSNADTTTQGGSGTPGAPRVRKWEIEVHGGGLKAYNPADGLLNLPGAGASFTTIVGLPSRRVSSWYLGDGAQLFNQAGSALRLTQEIAPLDPVLSATVTRTGNAIVGGRLSRAMNSRVSAEFSVDYNHGTLEISTDTLAKVEATRASFTSAWNAVIATGPFTAPTVTSTGDVHNHQGRQLLTVGTAVVNLTTRGRLTPFLTAGGGIVSNIGDTPDVTLTGKYQFLMFGVRPIAETDVVTVRYSVPRREFLGVFGGGFAYAASVRSGLRVDMRVHVNQNAVATLVSAKPAVQTQSPAGGIASFTTPSVQFSNSVAIGPSTLSGPAITDFESFKGRGWTRHVDLTAGWYWKF